MSIIAKVRMVTLIELQSSYNATMVVLSCLIASIASYTGLSMAIQYAAASTGRSRLAWLACGTAVMGAGIWAVCFYEINAYKWSTGIDYDYSTVLLTLAIAAASAALILRAFSRSKLRKRALLARGGIAGICAAAMPFAGLRTMRCSLAPRFDAPTIVLFALGVALMFVVILWIAHKLQSSRGPRRKAVAGVLLGTAYTAAIHIGLALTSWKSPEDVPVAIQSSSSATISFLLGFATLFVIGIAFAALFMERFWKAQMRRQLERDMRIESLFRHSQDAVFSYSLEGKLLDANLAAFRLTGYEWEDLSRLKLSDMISPSISIRSPLTFGTRYRGSPATSTARSSTAAAGGWKSTIRTSPSSSKVRSSACTRSSGTLPSASRPNGK